MRIGLVVPHIFMQDSILPNVIFSPAHLAINLANNLQALGNEVYFFTPGKVKTDAKNITTDLSYFQNELDLRGDTYLDLLKKHPFTFVTLARQVQSELIADAIQMANEDKLDIVHIYTNEEDIALPFAKLCNKPVVFTHHDPFNFLVKYKSVFPKYSNLNWLSMSLAQRNGMPKNTNWVANIYHGLPLDMFKPKYSNNGEYVLYMGRIISSKGVHLAIKAVQAYNKKNSTNLKLIIAGKHYSENAKDVYWADKIEPELKDPCVEYAGFIKETKAKEKLLQNAKALIIPSVFDEPFGMVMIEALACATPVIGLDSGAIGEVIEDSKNGYLVSNTGTEIAISKRLAAAIENIAKIDRVYCRKSFEAGYTDKRMAEEHLQAYRKLIKE